MRAGNLNDLGRGIQHYLGRGIGTLSGVIVGDKVTVISPQINSHAGGHIAAYAPIHCGRCVSGGHV